jgi:uncharacterized protein YecT (DUF1311 family)
MRPLTQNRNNLALMKLPLWLLIITAIALSLTSISTAPSTAQEANCKSPQTTRDMIICTGSEAQAADRQLNQVYQQLIRKLDGRQKERLTTAQLAWINFRDRTCAYEQGRFEGGTFAPVANASCLARVTQQRTKDLENYLQAVNNQ